jgi:hypothetical protein
MKHPEWKTALLTAREAYMLENYAAARDFGVPAKNYSDKTANGLTACIMDFLKYNGHYSNRINTTGMLRQVKGQMKWTKSGTRKGTADIDAIINGKPVKIEIKIGRDKMSDEQKTEQHRVTAAGGVYIVCKKMDDFYNWYLEFVESISIKTRSLYNI